MWGPSLFFITILVATTSGREVLEAYASQISTLFAAQYLYSCIALGYMAVLTLVFLLMMRTRRAEAPAVCLVRREIRGSLGSAGQSWPRRRTWLWPFRFLVGQAGSLRRIVRPPVAQQAD